MPQAPLRTLQDRRAIGKICVGGTRAEATCRLQRVLKTKATCHSLARPWLPAAPRAAAAITRHHHRTVLSPACRAHPGRGERLRECVRGGRLAIAGKGEALHRFAFARNGQAASADAFAQALAAAGVHSGTPATGTVRW